MKPEAFYPVILFMLICLAVQAREVPAENLLELVMKINTVNFDWQGQVELEISRQKKKEKLELLIFSRGDDTGYLAMINQPAFRRGLGYLKNADGFFIYYPGINTFIRPVDRQPVNPLLPACNIIFDKSFLSEFRITAQSEAQLGEHSCLLLELAAGSAGNFPSLRLWIDQDSQLIIKEEYCNRAGEAVTVVYRQWIRVADQFLPGAWEISDHGSPGESVRGRLTDVNIAALPDFIFTRAYLQFVCGNQ